MKRIIQFFPVLFLALSVSAGNPLENFTNNPIMENANISLMVKELESNNVLYQFRSNNVTIPASTMKLVTTATALEMLGPTFCFQTKLEIDGTINAEGTLNGNLYILGGGDPTLGSEYIGDQNFLSGWVEAVKKAGIKKINGRIIADGTLYDEEGVNPKWTWEDIGNYFAAGAYGITYLDNTYKLVLKSGFIGTVPEIIRTEPEMTSLTFDNHLISSTISFDSAYFYGAPHSNYRSIRGEIPANRVEFVIKGDIPNPGLLLAEHLQYRLVEAGIKISQLPTDILKKESDRKLIFTYDSPQLKDIIAQTNIHSINGFAEEIFRYLALNTNPVASSKGAITEVRSFWKSKNLPINQLFMYDGCGLSPVDAVSSNFLVQLLSYMATRSANKEEFRNSLPVSGVDGTLKNFLNNTPLKGKVHAKSGTISGVKSYAGYMELKNKTYVFAIMVNHANGTAKEVTKKIEEFLLKVSNE